MKRDNIGRILKQVLNEAAEKELLQIQDMGGATIMDNINNAHRLLNKVQTALMMKGASESELFKRVNQCDNELINLLNGR